MKPPAFDYYRADTIKDVTQVLAAKDESIRILAGGQSLLPMLNMRLLKPSSLVDISGVAELNHIKQDHNTLEVGASVTQAQLLAYVQQTNEHLLLQQAMPWVGHYQTRQRGTVCGSIVHSDPSSELPLCLAMLNGSVVLQQAGKGFSKSKTREVSAADFQQGLMQTDVRPGELVTAVRFQRPPSDTRFAFREVSHRHGDFAIVALAVARRNDELHIGIAGMADRPAIKPLSAVNGKNLDEELNEIAWQLGGSDDAHASARYRRDLLRRLGRQLVEEVARP